MITSIGLIQINSNKKFKVITIKTDAIWILKLIYFVVYDVVYFINVFYFLINFERKKLNKYIIIVYQSLGYICNGAIYFLLLTNKKNCVKSRNDKNIFYKENYMFEAVISMLFDIIKFFIK